MRRLLFLVLLLAGVFVIADRVSAAIAARAVASRIQASENLSTRPHVSFGGFPFLTQAFSGSYDDIDVTAHNLHPHRIPVSKLTVHLHNAHVPLGAALRRDVKSIPVSRLDATALFTFADMNSALADRGLHVSPAGSDQVRVTGRVRGVSASVVSSLRVSGDVLEVSAQQALVTIAGVPVNVGTSFDFTIDASGLPFQLHLSGASVSPDGIAVSASAHGIVIQGS